MSRESKKNIDVNGYEYYRTTLSVGKNSEGKPVIKQFYGSSKKDSENKKAEYIKSLSLGLNPDLSKQSLTMAMDIWIWSMLKNSGIKATSFERYEGIYRNYIKDTDLGLLTISSIKRLGVQQYYDKLRQEGKTLSQIENLHKLLRKFFEYAESEEYVVRNPCKGIRLPKDHEEDIDECDDFYEAFTQNEISSIIDKLGHTKLKYIVEFAFLTGARQGEILALEKSDIQGDFVNINKTIKNNKVYNKDDGSYEYKQMVTKPKSKNSKRSIPMPAKLKSDLKKLEKLIAEEKLKLGQAYDDNNLLFPSETGTYLNARNLRRSWERALKKHNVPYKKFHALRHTYATILFEKGVSLIEVSRLMGHSTVRTTEIYTHILPDFKADGVQCLNDVIL